MTPLILPLGDRSLLVRFGDLLTEPTNVAAIGFARAAEAAGLPGVLEVVPNLVSVLLRYDPGVIGFERLAGEVRLLASVPLPPADSGRQLNVAVHFDGPDIAEVAANLGLSVEAFIAAHNAAPLRILSTGFAPGFVYCGMHPERLRLPRRAEVRRQVPAGTVLFAAGQTAITSTPIPTGWHVIGRTAFRNAPPEPGGTAVASAGDSVVFEMAP